MIKDTKAGDNSLYSYFVKFVKYSFFYQETLQVKAELSDEEVQIEKVENLNHDLDDNTNYDKLEHFNGDIYSMYVYMYFSVTKKI